MYVQGARRYIPFALVIVLLIGVAALWQANSSPYPELRELEKIASAQENSLFRYFEDLAKKKGGVYAYEVLRRANLPPDVDLHLLGHVVGDELYKQEGIEGMARCTQEFRNACSHSIVVGAFNEFGEGALPRISEACSRAPGGTGAYTMCFHGLGHGIFAYYGYEIPPAIAICKRTGTEAKHEREYNECVGGIIMELTGGGGHDRTAWLKSRATYLTADPLSPCSSAIIPDEVKDVCYVYLAPQLFAYAGADMAQPTPRDFAQAFVYCDAISKETPHLREACFGGIGKEFPVLAMRRDIRALERASTEELITMDSWCGVAPHDEAKSACRQAILNSLFWGGENDPALSSRFCSVLSNNAQSDCFDHLSLLIGYYGRGDWAEAACALLPIDHQDACRIGIQS